MKNTIWVFSLEPIETRYTCEWFTELPKTIENYIEKNNLDFNVAIINGENCSESNKATEGAFLNFLDTNYWKSTQLLSFIKAIKLNKVKNGDKILITDAWNPCILQLRYIKDLMKIDFDIYNIWHAGSYDKNDFLGREIKEKDWTYNAEESFYYSAEKNFFATYYHENLFHNELGNKNLIKSNVCGLPFDYLREKAKKHPRHPKENLILFPHRISVEKQPEIFRYLEKCLPKYKFIICQEENLTKSEYWDLLSRAKMVFSANLQETLGISCYEGLLMGCIPLVPDRLSYTEMYSSNFKYHSDFTRNYESFIINSLKLSEIIKEKIENYDYYSNSLFDSEIKKLDNYFSSQKMLDLIFLL